MSPKLYASVAIGLKELSLEHLAALNICVQLDQDPHGRVFDYNTVSFLFTENNGTKAHDETKEAVSQYVYSRLTEKPNRRTGMTLQSWSIWYWDNLLMPKWVLLYGETKEKALEHLKNIDGFWKLESIEEWN